MKRIVFVAAFVMAFAGLKAQDCETLMLPYFGYDANRMAAYKAEVPDKFAIRCAYVRAAFYESDTVPTGAAQYSINVVRDRRTNEALNDQTVIDLNTLSYYAYNFYDLQVAFPTGEQVICFSTPGSAHPYLVLRSIDQMHQLSAEFWEQTYGNKQ